MALFNVLFHALKPRNFMIPLVLLVLRKFTLLFHDIVITDLLLDLLGCLVQQYMVVSLHSVLLPPLLLSLLRLLPDDIRWMLYLPARRIVHLILLPHGSKKKKRAGRPEKPPAPARLC